MGRLKTEAIKISPALLHRTHDAAELTPEILADYGARMRQQGRREDGVRNCEKVLRQFYDALPADKAVTKNSLPAWREQLLLLLRLMEADRSFFLTALDPRFESEFRSFFIEQLTKNQDCPLTPLQTAALASILLHWLQRENRETPENLLAIFEQLMRDSSWKPEMLDLLS